MPVKVSFSFDVLLLFFTPAFSAPLMIYNDVSHLPMILPFILTKTSGYATMVHGRGAIRIALRQLSQTWKLRHYDVIYDVIIWVQDGNCKKWLERILVLVRSTI